MSTTAGFFGWLEISKTSGFFLMAGNWWNGRIFSNGWKLVKWLDSFGWLEMVSMAGYSLLAGYSQMTGNQLLPNGWKLVELLDNFEWLEVGRKAR